MDAFTTGILSLLGFFSIVTFGSVYLYSKSQRNQAEE